jgi:hypothetical protein
VAQLSLAGTILFDLGNAATPSFTAMELYDATVKSEGAMTFKYEAQQYLVITDHPGGCDTGALLPEATLFQLDGITSTDLTNLQCLETAPDTSFWVQGGLYLQNSSGTHVYLIEKSNMKVHDFEVSGTGASLQLSYIGQPLYGYEKFGASIRADTKHDLLVSAVPGIGTGIYDISDLSSPVLLSTLDPYLGGIWASRAAIRWPVVWAAQQAATHTFTFTIHSPDNPVPLDQGFWDPAHEWNSYTYLLDFDAEISPDGKALYLARFSVFEVVTLDGCLGIFSDGFESGDTTAWSSVLP